MYVADGIAYAGERAPEIKVCGVRPLAGHKLTRPLATERNKGRAHLDEIYAERTTRRFSAAYTSTTGSRCGTTGT